MKYLFLTICFALNILSNVNAHTTANQSDEAVYAIQLAASSQPDLTKFKSVKRYGYLYTASTNSGTQKILLGTFTSRSSAKSTLAKVKAKGFKDAYISTTPLISDSKVYSVQFISYAYSNVIDWEQFSYLGDVRIDATGGKVKLLSSIFYDKESARAHASTLASEGYPGAFIREINEGMLLSPYDNFVSTPYTLSSSETISTGTSTVSHSSTSSFADPYQSSVYTNLSEAEKDLVVYLDGVLNIKQNNAFVPLSSYTPGSQTMTATTTEIVTQPSTVTYSEPTVVHSTTQPVTQPTATVFYGDDFTPKGGTVIYTEPIKETAPVGTVVYSEPVVETAPSNIVVEQPATTVVSSIPSSSNSYYSGVVYKVQITAVKMFDPLKFSSVENLGTVDVESNASGVNRVLLGTFFSQTEAKEKLAKIKAHGFDQAYVVEYKDGIRSKKID